MSKDNKKIGLIFLGVLSLVVLIDACYAETWKIFTTRNDAKYSYDKDSIHYPHKTKGLLGI